MNRLELISSLDGYNTLFPEEMSYVPRFKSLLINFPSCYNRSLTTGHMTGSSWIIDEKGWSVLLVHHKKLNRWLQPGGHADGEEDIISVASKEAEEETGLKSLKLLSDHVFDIDIHLIPTHKDVKSHFHHDIRFMFTADINERYTVSDESNELAWISLDSIHEYIGNNDSIHRMVLKTKKVFNKTYNSYIYRPLKA